MTKGSGLPAGALSPPLSSSSPSREGEDQEGWVWLQQACPLATPAECHRFYHAWADPHPHRQARRHREKARQNLQAYLQWRQEYQLDDERPPTPRDETRPSDVDQDALDWKESLALAWQVHQSKKGPTETHASSSAHQRKNPFLLRRNLAPEHRPESSTTTVDSLASAEAEDLSVRFPQPIFAHRLPSGGGPWQDGHGHGILHLLPARMDVLGEQGKADASEMADLYLATMALYLDRKFDRHQPPQSQLPMTLLIDVRPGRGWPNPPALQMVSFIKHVATALHRWYPGCLYRGILYPVPWTAVFIWQVLIQPFLDPSVAALIVLIPGSATLLAPLPWAKLAVAAQVADPPDPRMWNLLEQKRLEAFVPPSPPPGLVRKSPR